MTLGELILEGLIKDDEQIQILKPICGTVRTLRGLWYQDHILNLKDMEIGGFRWNKAEGWEIYLTEEDMQSIQPTELPFS